MIPTTILEVVSRVNVVNSAGQLCARARRRSEWFHSAGTKDKNSMLEFAFVKERKAEALLGNAADNIMDFVQQLSPTERAASLAWANAALLAGKAEYGRELAHAPTRMKPELAVKAVMDFAAYRKQIEDTVEAVNARPAHDPAVAAYKWELLGAQTVMVTAGAALTKQSRAAAREIWAVLAKSTPYAAEAVKAMLIYGKTYDLEVIPPVPNKKGDKAFLLALASSLPPMFRAS